MDGSRAKMKPIFARGFLDRPVRKKSTGWERTAQLGDQGASPSSKCNGYSNGHFNSGWDVEMANGNVDDGDDGDGNTISSNSNMISISPGLSNGHRHDHTERNGISAGMCCESTSNGSGGGGFGFKMDEVLSSYGGSDIKTSKSKSSECGRDENQRLNQSNGFSTADPFN